MVSLFRNRKSGEIVLVRFALDRKLGGGSVARGAMRRLTEEQFREVGVESVNQALADFYILTDDDKSELYQRMPEDERNRFLASHDQLNIAVPKSGEVAKLYPGPTLHLSRTLTYPFDRSTFAEVILTEFGKISP
jgi:hypothetical protein